MSVEDLAEGLAELAEHHEGYVTAHHYYAGTAGEVFASARLRRLLRATGDKYRMNLAKTPVDCLHDRLEIAAVTVPENDALTSVLEEQVWKPNALLLESPEIMRRAGEYGDAYVIVWQGKEEGTVTIDYNSPCVARMIYDDENPREKKYLVKMWEEKALKLRRANIYYADVVERYSQPAGAKPNDSASWVEFTDDEIGTWPIPNPWGEVPAFHFRNGRPYGTPEHFAAYGAQDLINKMVITLANTTDYHGAPQRWALAEAGTDSDDDGGDDFLDDNTTAGLSGNPGSGLKAGAGELWWLQGVKGVGQFASADPAVFLDPTEFAIRMMAQLTTTPLHYFDPSGDVPSGESLRAADAPLTKKAQNRRMAYAHTWSDVFVFALKILGYSVTGVDIRWAPIVSTDDLDIWQVAKAKIEAGVSVRQALMEAGYTDEQVDPWLDSTDDDDLKRRVEMLAQIGAASRDLGTAVSFGVLDAAAVQKLILNILDPVGERDNSGT